MALPGIEAIHSLIGTLKSCWWDVEEAVSLMPKTLMDAVGYLVRTKSAEVGGV